MKRTITVGELEERLGPQIAKIMLMAEVAEAYNNLVEGTEGGSDDE